MIKKCLSLISLAMLTALFICACSPGELNTPSTAEPGDNVTVKGAEHVSGIDINSYDLNVTCLKINDNILSVSDIGYDGDERDKHSITQYTLADDVKFFSKEESKVIYSENNKSETTITYSLLERSELEKTLNEDNAPASTYIWLDANGNCKYIMTYGGITLWE